MPRSRFKIYQMVEIERRDGNNDAGGTGEAAEGDAHTGRHRAHSWVQTLRHQRGGAGREQSVPVPGDPYGAAGKDSQTALHQSDAGRAEHKRLNFKKGDRNYA